MEFWNKKFDRRNFLKAGAAGVAAVAAASLPSVATKTKVAQAAAIRNVPTTRIGFSEMQKLTPTEMAKRSPLREYGYNYLMEKAKAVKDYKVREAALYGLNSPNPKILELYPNDAAKEATRAKLLDAGFIKSENTIEQIFPTLRSDLKFWDSVGAGWGGHHAYPAGLITHVSTDLETALGINEIYKENFGYSMREDLITNAILLHDNTKPWIMQYKEDHSVLGEIKIGGTGAHHIQAIADVMMRDFDPDLVVCLADSHDHPGTKTGEDKCVAYIKSAAIIAGVDPIKRGYLSATDKIRAPHAPEGYLVHLGDGDWVLTSMIARVAREQLALVAKQDYKLTDEELKGIKYNNLRNYVFSQASDMHLYQTFVERGYEAFRQAVLSIVVPD